MLYCDEAHYVWVAYVVYEVNEKLVAQCGLAVLELTMILLQDLPGIIEDDNSLIPYFE